ncbi:MAG: hypothetical protein JXL20_02780 [Deltaproteobacteria bacterium]|nr:hypothetical protein [Deltaproteobacteria bacterium]
MNERILVLILLMMAAAGAALFAQPDFPTLTGPYLGQEPPGMTPRMFAPGIVSLEGFHDFKGVFSADGREYYFCRHSLPQMMPTLFFARIEDGAWTEPAVLPIAQGNRTFHLCISPDNQWLLFYWQFKPEHPRPSAYYASARTDAGWSAPRYAGPGMCVTADRTGFLYANEMLRGSPPEFHMTKITFSQGLFTHHGRVNIAAYAGKQTHPCIVPDGSYLVFDIEAQNTRLFVCFRDQEGNWGEVIDLTRHGLPPGARGACISPDGRYLFYGFEGDIWWVDIQVIEQLRPEPIK